MTELREQIERQVIDVYRKRHASGLMRGLGPVEPIVDLILEHRAKEAEHCTVNFNATNAGPGLRRARELRAMIHAKTAKGESERG